MIHTPIFGNVMPRDRFLAISKYLHLCNYDNIDRTDRLHKIRPLFDLVESKFRRNYTPNQEISIDQSLVKCRGRLLYIQCSPKKRARFGIKLYKLRDSTNAYICSFDIYVGKEKIGDLPASQKVVLQMRERCDVLYKGYNLYIDN